LKDAYHRPFAPVITEAAKAWVISVACIKPKDLGLAAELWTLSALARHIAVHAEAAGFPRLARAGKSTVWRILDEHQLKPHKITYYLEKRDPDFDRKMHEVLMVYQDVSLSAAGEIQAGRPHPVYTISVDEKPGVQALGLTATGARPGADRESGLRVRAAWHGIDSGRYRSAYGARVGPRGRPASKQ
jgi:hypothetical protein